MDRYLVEGHQLMRMSKIDNTLTFIYDIDGNHTTKNVNDGITIHTYVDGRLHTR